MSVKSSKLKRKIFSYCCLLLSLGFCELIISFLHIGKLEGKRWLIEKDFNANCYSSDSRSYFPINLKSDANQQKDFAKLFGDEKLKDLQSNFPYCIIYNKSLRLHGTQPNLPTAVATVGDSFTFGEGVKDEDTLAALLGRSVPNTNFKNFGSQGANITTVFDQVKNASDDPSINSIIYFYNLNDILLSDEILSHFNSIVDLQNVLMDSSYDSLPSLMRWLKKSALFRSLWVPLVKYRSTNDSVNLYNEMYNSELNKEFKTATFKTISDMQTYATQKNKNFYVIIYPLLYKDSKGSYPFTDIHNQILHYCELNKIRCYDGIQAFAQDNNWQKLVVHPFDSHPNQEANKQMVSWLTKKVLK